MAEEEQEGRREGEDKASQKTRRLRPEHIRYSTTTEKGAWLAGANEQADLLSFSLLEREIPPIDRMHVFVIPIPLFSRCGMRGPPQ